MLRELSRTFTFLMVAALTKSDSPVTLRSRMSKYTVAVVCVFALGAALRLTAFFHDRSLWLDEAMLARNVISRSYSELARPLAYHQGAPLGYLAAVKTFVLIEGINEYRLTSHVTDSCVNRSWIVYSICKDILPWVRVGISVRPFRSVTDFNLLRRRSQAVFTGPIRVCFVICTLCPSGNVWASSGALLH